MRAASSADPIYDPEWQEFWRNLVKVQDPSSYTPAQGPNQYFNILRQAAYDRKPTLQEEWPSIVKDVAERLPEPTGPPPASGVYWDRLCTLTIVVASHVDKSLWPNLAYLERTTWLSNKENSVRKRNELQLLAGTALEAYMPILFFHRYNKITAKDLQESVGNRYKAFQTWFATDFAAHEPACPSLEIFAKSYTQYLYFMERTFILIQEGIEDQRRINILPMDAIKTFRGRVKPDIIKTAVLNRATQTQALMAQDEVVQKASIIRFEELGHHRATIKKATISLEHL
ncbi:hypothetical protein CROQUDRAFT_664387 [Cronartium quercuum f. sp. fusiforme G11]|uniref:Uncharacterized protein n=1 Tax=Cronartium quercuum f. sp. fusiforme G11 TaxID=708437 RepID=A0A9P6T6P1_9BASI|nr:hypothetical protein CROQUDRAFT_664387 [Cronartium quercuum f. sp. fusiforme G11]